MNDEYRSRREPATSDSLGYTRRNSNNTFLSFFRYPLTRIILRPSDSLYLMLPSAHSTLSSSIPIYAYLYFSDVAFKLLYHYCIPFIRFLFCGAVVPVINGIHVHTYSITDWRNRLTLCPSRDYAWNIGIIPTAHYRDDGSPWEALQSSEVLS